MNMKNKNKSYLKRHYTFNKDLAYKLTKKAKQVTQSAEQEMTNWVKSVQNRNNIEFFI